MLELRSSRWLDQLLLGEKCNNFCLPTCSLTPENFSSYLLTGRRTLPVVTPFSSASPEVAFAMFFSCRYQLKIAGSASAGSLSANLNSPNPVSTLLPLKVDVLISPGFSYIHCILLFSFCIKKTLQFLPLPSAALDVYKTFHS